MIDGRDNTLLQINHPAPVDFPLTAVRIAGEKFVLQLNGQISTDLSLTAG